MDSDASEVPSFLPNNDASHVPNNSELEAEWWGIYKQKQFNIMQKGMHVQAYVKAQRNQVNFLKSWTRLSDWTELGFLLKKRKESLGNTR